MESSRQGSSEELLVPALQDFLQVLESQRWIPAGAALPASVDAFTLPHRLFDPGKHRPLTAAFFGGTGVGKSTLLNRLAGSEVARTGLERPTSREMSLYLHESITLKALPQDLPLSAVRVARHSREAFRQILWIDMPDIDSVDENNRRLVLEWLPLIDVLIYVVSPERYRDDKGWTLLRQHGGDHAWVFVLNQWDRADPVQLEDFKALLRQAGFEEPIVFRTDSSGSAVAVEDDCPRLESLLSDLSSRHLRAQLEQKALRVRLESLTHWLEGLKEGLGFNQDYLKALQPSWERLWNEAMVDLLEGLEWPLRTLVRSLLNGTSHPAPQEPQSSAKDPASTGTAPLRGSESTPVLWDEWARGRVEDALSQVLVVAGEKGLPLWPLKTRLTALLDPLGVRVNQRAQLRLRMALAVPGNALQRRLMQGAGALSILLPLSALSWASYQVVTGYYRSAIDHLDYLGTDFAVHTVLLIGLSWLFPWFLYTRLRPSVEASARKGLREGIREALVGMEDDVLGALASTTEEHLHIKERLEAFSQGLKRDLSSAEAMESSPLLRRLMAHQEPHLNPLEPP